jgi:hypothetical protein
VKAFSIDRELTTFWELTSFESIAILINVRCAILKILSLTVIDYSSVFCLISLLGFVKKMITTVRRELCYGSSFQDIRSPPFGKTQARNIFKDFCVGENINDPNEVTKVANYFFIS